MATGTSLVLVLIGDDDLATYVHPIGDNVCASDITRAEFRPVHGAAVPDVRVEWKPPCTELLIASADFKPAQIEVHKPPKRKPPTLVKK